jgi:hypothetical protein
MWGRKARARAEEERRRAEFVAQLVEVREADKPARSRFELTRNVLAAARRATFRARRVLAPFAVLAVIAAVGGWVQARQVPLPAVLALTAAAAGAWWRLRAHRLDRMQERRYAALCLALAAGWLVWVPIAGPAWSALVAGWTVVALPWWRHHWPRPRIDVPEVEPVGDPIINLWDAHVGSHTGPLPGARLIEPRPFPHGTEYRAQGVPGRQAIGTALSNLDLVASGLRTPRARIVVEQHPDYDDPTEWRLRHVKKSPVKDTQWFHEPRWDDQGRILLGPYADGMDNALWRLYVRNGMYGGGIFGSPGQGKTRILEQIAVTVRSMSAAGRPTVLVYVDGQDGASSPLLWRYATIRGGPREAPEILDGLLHNLRLRQQWNRYHGLSGFTPGQSPDGGKTPGLPGLLCIVDECHVIWESGSAALAWCGPAREGRKAGIAEIAADQHSGLEVFGGQEVLRASLFAGNGLAMHTASNIAGSLVPGLDVHPSQIPAIPGFGFKIPGAGSGERTAPFRARYMPDANDAAEDPDLPVPTVEDWFERTADAPLDEMSARAFGSLYADREAREVAARESALAEIEGRLPERERILVTAAATPTATSVTAGATTASVVFAYLTEHGPQKREDIVKHVETTLGTGLSAVKAALTKLQTDHVIERDDRHGVYQAID